MAKSICFFSLVVVFPDKKFPPLEFHQAWLIAARINPPANTLNPYYFSLPVNPHAVSKWISEGSVATNRSCESSNPWKRGCTFTKRTLIGFLSYIIQKQKYRYPKIFKLVCPPLTIYLANRPEIHSDTYFRLERSRYYCDWYGVGDVTLDRVIDRFLMINPMKKWLLHKIAIPY